MDGYHNMQRLSEEREMATFNTKLDTLIATVERQGEQIKAMQSSIDASKGAIVLLKLLAILSGACIAALTYYHSLGLK